MSRKSRSYKVKDWHSYNQVLQDRWSMDIWLSPETVEQWYNKEHHGKKGASHTYTNQAILSCLIVRALFNLSLRATQRFLRSLFEKLGLDIECLHYSQLCRRAELLSNLPLPRLRKGEASYMAIDSTGLKVYGEGEWHVKIHKASKKRTWRKLHIAIDPVTQEILSAELTPSRCGDSTMLPHLFDLIEDPISKVWADGAYDYESIYQYLHKKRIKPIIPPHKGSKPSYSYQKQSHLEKRRWVHSKPHLVPRDDAINFISLNLANSLKEREYGRNL